jgi:hypothetical protein
MFVEDKGLLIEFNGLYWHGDLIKDNKYYHYNKYKLSNDNNYKLFSIWEDDWNFKKDIVKSMLLNRINKTPTLLNARECEIKEVANTRKFLNNNHLQGWCQSSVNLGLYYNDELVSLMTFGKRKISGNTQYELLRFCNKIYTNIRGAASKLFKHFQQYYYKGENITSFASCDYSDGKLYNILGFKKIKHTGINYWWCDNSKKYHRSNFMKYKLVKEGFDKNKTENEIMRERGFYKIFNSGNLKYNKKGPKI